MEMWALFVATIGIADERERAKSNNGVKGFLNWCWGFGAVQRSEKYIWRNTVFLIIFFPVPDISVSANCGY